MLKELLNYFLIVRHELVLKGTIREGILNVKASIACSCVVRCLSYLAAVI